MDNEDMEQEQEQPDDNQDQPDGLIEHRPHGTKRRSSPLNRTTGQILNHRMQTAELYLKGKTQIEIAALIGHGSRDIVKHDMAAIRKTWLERTFAAFDAKKAEEDARLYKIEAEAWDAWEASKGARRHSETRINRGGGFAGGNITETLTALDDSHGDPRFLIIALKAVDRRIKLWGLDEPDKSVSLSLELVKVYSGDLDLSKI